MRLRSDAERTAVEFSRAHPVVTIVLGLAIALQLSALVLAGVSWLGSGRDIGDGWYIAYIGRFDNPDFDVLHERSLRLFLGEPIAGREVGLRTIDLRDWNGPDGSTAGVYRKLQGDPRCLAVIDNTWGKHLAGARDAIRVAGLPVVSINGDCNDLDYDGRVVFMGHDERAAGYISRLLTELQHVRGEEYDGVVFVGERDFPSTAAFLRELDRYEIDPRLIHVRTREVGEMELELARRDLDQALSSIREGGRHGHVVLVMNVHADWGREIIRHVTALDGPRVTLVGGEYTFSNSQAADFDGSRGHRLLLVTSPSDAISQRAALAVGTLSRRHGRGATDRRNAGLFVQRCGRALSLLRTILHEADQKTGYAGAGRGSIEDARAHLLARFEALRNRSVLVDGRLFQLDQHMRVGRDTRLQLIDHGLPRSFPHQLVRQTIDDELSGPPESPLVPNVYIGVNLEDVSDIDLSEGTFFADFLLSVSVDRQYADVIPTPQELFLFRNQRRDDRLERITDIDNERTVGHIYRCTGVFSNKYETAAYPFDTQLLSLDLELKTHGPEVTLSFDDDSFGRGMFHVDPEVVRGWRFQRIFGGVDQAIAYGAPESDQRLTRFTFNIEVGRGKLRPIGTLILPLTGIGLCSVLVLFLRNLAIDRIGEISVGTFIGFIAYVIFYTEIAPRSSVVTYADWLFYATFAVTLLQLVLVILGNVLFSPAAMTDAPRIHAIRVGRWIVAFGYAASVGAVLWTALFA